MKLANIKVDSGWHERKWCPVSVELELGADVDTGKLILWDLDDGTAVPVQAYESEDKKIRLDWIITWMEPQQTTRYELRASEGSSTEMTSGVHLSESGKGKLDVNVGGNLFTTYNFGEEVVRPYLYPVYADKNVGITRNWPMVTGVEGETEDHPHHKGIYTAQGEVNGVDNWGEGEGHGYQIHKEFLKTYDGPIAGGFEENLVWTDSGRKANMSEMRQISFYSTPSSRRIIDYAVTLTASEGKVTLADTKEAGLLSVRVATSMDAANQNGGMIINGMGGIQEKETWGKHAPWCDYSGPIGDRWYGICLMDHPTNPRYPTPWHVRNYGLMTANCFGFHHFTGDPDNMQDLIIEDGQSETWRYRILIHHGSGTDLDISEYFHDFANPPVVEIDTSV